MRIDGNGESLPVDQIAAHRMGPVLGNSRTVVIGIVLVKQVVIALVINQSVGIA